MKTSSGIISIAASAPRLAVDNRISLRNYYRIANNLIKQAEIYREENDIINLYIMLLRFSSLITETIPYHRDYQVSLHGEKLLFKKKLLHVMSELEALKPDVQQGLEDLNQKSSSQFSRWSQNFQNTSVNNSFEWPSVRKEILKTDTRQLYPVRLNGVSRFPLSQQDILPQSKLIGEQKHNLSLTKLWPKEETLSRHSILGPNGLSACWQPPVISQQIQYPSNIDLSPIEIPSLSQLKLDDPITQNIDASSQGSTILAEVFSLHDDGVSFHAEEPPSSMISFDAEELPAKLNLIRDPLPPPVHAEVKGLVAMASPLSNSIEQTSLSKNEMVGSESSLEVHISSSLMESFLRVAKSNTDRCIETCGVIAGLLKNRKFFVTALIIPKQEGTSDSCQTTNEEEIFDYQDKHSLFPLGWIHTHPTQSCFMSSIDVHTHYSYQVMLPEAIAIVMAPSDSSSKHGIFRLTTPGGMSVVRKCDQRGFHPHASPPDGGPIYDRCSDVYMNPALKIDVVDLR